MPLPLEMNFWITASMGFSLWEGHLETFPFVDYAIASGSREESDCFSDKHYLKVTLA